MKIGLWVKLKVRMFKTHSKILFVNGQWLTFRHFWNTLNTFLKCEFSQLFVSLWIAKVIRYYKTLLKEPSLPFFTSKFEFMQNINAFFIIILRIRLMNFNVFIFRKFYKLKIPICKIIYCNVFKEGRQSQNMELQFLLQNLIYFLVTKLFYKL